MSTSSLGFPIPPVRVNGYLYTPPGSSKTYKWSDPTGAWIIQTAQNTATSVVSPLVIITSATNSISTETGALVVKGGVGIGGDVHIGGILFTNDVPVLTATSFNISDGPDGGVDTNIVHVVDPVSHTSTILINNISTLDTVTSRGAVSSHVITITNATSSTSVSSGALVVTGGVGIAGRVNTESIQIADTVFDSTDTFVNSTDEYVVDSYLLSQYTSSKYFIQISDGTNSHAVEMILTASSDGTPYMTQYGQVTTAGELGTFSATGESTSGGDILISLTFRTTIFPPTKRIKVLRTAMTSGI